MHAPVLYMVKAWVSPDGGERYLASPARERFWRELEPLGDVQRAERFYGTVDLRLEAASSS